MVPVSDRIWIKPDEVWITGSKIRKDEENKNEKENREQGTVTERNVQQ